jgi:hypothetical protein
MLTPRLGPPSRRPWAIWQAYTASSAVHLGQRGVDLSDFAVTVAGRSLGMEHPTIVHDCTFRGYRRAAVECTFRFHDFGPGGNNLQLIDCTWDDPDQGRDFLWGAGTDVHEATYMDVTDARHGSIKLRRGDQSGALNPAWNARVSPL